MTMAKKLQVDKEGVAIVRSRKDFEDIYWYSLDQLEEKDCPKKYPCIVEIIFRNGGLGGDWTDHHITYIPENLDPQAFLAGYKKGREVRD